MMVFRKIQAGALQFVLFIGAIVALLLLSFLLLTYTQKHFEKKSGILVEVLQGTDYGIKASLTNTEQSGKELSIQKLGDLPIEIRVEKGFWGLLEKRTVTSSHKNTTYTKYGLVGGKDTEEIPALYVSDHQRPVVLAGNTKITGTAYLPKQGLKMGNIGGNSYPYPRLLYGNSIPSKEKLPELSGEFKARLREFSNPNYRPNGILLQALPREGIKNSFQEETKVFKSGSITLENIALTGNLIIVADKKITVRNTVQLRDVVLLAPEIIIEDRVTGNFQAIATEKIEVGQGCQLFYPTVLVVDKSNKRSNQNTSDPSKNRSLFVDKYTFIKGFLMFMEEIEEKQYFPQVKVETNAIIEGEIFCSQNLELKGTVNGMVTTDGFMALENGNIYQNHIYGGIINSTQLSPHYVGIPLESRIGNKKLMQWLY
ncbi:hypothetical protein PP182_18405 [Maribacter sp. PR1]|uniref:Uncharacterized protein n=1 Tax=Maribacter cobaltidurans TaxID=1178778 RepID=A0ABU7IYI9_9FLAO|nr:MULTISPECIES: hypothetical protein [Maribacter]MDC6390665.1 hypothetical protein [Maribacter sp. PR1]MEE1978057.1 hypothetical protein [Maribacter cobaltidurans]